MYSATVKYTLLSENGEKTAKNSDCFAFLSGWANNSFSQYFHIQFKVKVHPDCVPYKKQWMGFLKAFGKFAGIKYSYDFDFDVFDFEAEKVPCRLSMWFLTFVRYLQEFPEIVVDFCSKNIDIDNDDGFDEFYKSHKTKCSFYNNIAGHGLTWVTSAPQKPSFEKYKKLLHEVLKTKTLSSIQGLFTQCCQ